MKSSCVCAREREEFSSIRTRERERVSFVLFSFISMMRGWSDGIELIWLLIAIPYRDYVRLLGGVRERGSVGFRSLSLRRGALVLRFYGYGRNCAPFGSSREGREKKGNSESCFDGRGGTAQREMMRKFASIKECNLSVRRVETMGRSSDPRENFVIPKLGGKRKILIIGRLFNEKLFSIITCWGSRNHGDREKYAACRWRGELLSNDFALCGRGGL